MAASMLNRVCVTLRGPRIPSAVTRRHPQYSTAPVSRGNRSPPNFRFRKEPAAPRTSKMQPDQDWNSVYPTAAVFKPSTVPLPVRMGYPIRSSVPPDKTGNLELVKIPNFLHLTPVAIKQHCSALREFCTPFPSALSSNELCAQLFPIEFQTVDYISSGPSLRNPKARAVTLQIKLSSLNLDDRARKKLIKLVGSRYSAPSDTLTIRADRCPVRRQNRDYALYLLTVLYHESWKTEAWESEKSLSDMEEYVWEGSVSERNAVQTLQRMGSADPAPREQILGSTSVQEYRDAVLNLLNQGESEASVTRYKQSVKSMLGIE
ncbi:small ribosomal subunit protein mS35 [Ascaphus truei]|uniref:small ribosomal subunit protein mS35 n=1 Tax=Ascaphus truei TaxID=8439 RepID=UPI003F5968AC